MHYSIIVNKNAVTFFVAIFAAVESNLFNMKYYNSRYFSYHFYKTTKITIWVLMLWLLLFFLLPLIFTALSQIDLVFKTKCMAHGIFVYVHPSMCRWYSRQVLVKSNEMVRNRLHHRKLEQCTLHPIRNLNLILTKIHSIEPIPFEWPNDFYKTGAVWNAECNEFDLDTSIRFTVIFIASFLCACVCVWQWSDHR